MQPRRAHCLALANRLFFVPAVVLGLGVCLAMAVIAPTAAEVESGLIGSQAKISMRLDIDATDLPRKLLYGTVTIPVDALVGTSGGDVALWYPKWLPGTHGPGGPVQNIAGMYFEDENGRDIEWTREPGEVYKVTAHMPAGSRQLIVTIRYITDQDSANSRGVDSYGSEMIGFVSANTVLLYPEAVPANATIVDTTLTLPGDWHAATALEETASSSKEPDQTVIQYAPTTLERVIDSPIMVGRYEKEYDLVENDMRDKIPPHRMELFSEAESVIDLPNDVLDAYRKMVTQTSRLFNSHPYDDFVFLVATTDALGRNGLEHLNCTMNIIGQRSLQSLKGIRGWDQMLLPHEWVHSWCGKYRRPAGMATDDFHTPKDTDLLWVYEGLTQYLGEVIEARCGLLEQDEMEWSLFNSVRGARYRQGRDWRPLVDTAAASHILRAGSRNWSHLRRGQDYYGEGALMWMEADAKIRNMTDDRKSLDDFCRIFFMYDEDAPNPKPYSRQDVIDALNEVLQYDWATFIRDRIDEPRDDFALGLLKELGYEMQFSNTPPEGPGGTSTDLLDCRDSIGATFGRDGSVREVLLDSPADAAGLGPDMKIVGVGDYVWSRERLIDAIAETVRTGEVKLMLVSGDRYVYKTIKYDGGPRFMRMVKVDDGNHRLSDILKPRKN